jgi:predicted kinase
VLADTFPQEGTDAEYAGLLEIVHGEAIDAARADLWASSLRQVDTRSSARTQIPAIRLDKDGWATQLGADVWDDEFRVRLERQLWALTQELLAQGQSVILEWGHWARLERDEKRLGARALGVGVELHYLDAPLEELIERAERRNASGEWTASPMTWAHFEQWATIFEPPEEEEFLLIDEPVPEA